MNADFIAQYLLARIDILRLACMIVGLSVGTTGILASLSCILYVRNEKKQDKTGYLGLSISLLTLMFGVLTLLVGFLIPTFPELATLGVIK